jgi:hypothetical protein
MARITARYLIEHLERLGFVLISDRRPGRRRCRAPACGRSPAVHSWDMSSSFMPRERELIRREFCRHFGQDPSIADGIFLRTWHSGPHKGAPKIPPTVQGLLDRGLVEIGPGRFGLRAFFTEAGLKELRALLQDRRAMNPERFGHLRRELGLDAGEGAVD